MADHRERTDRIDRTEKKDPTEKADKKDPIEQIENADPIDPIDMKDPRLAIDRVEPSDHSDHVDGAESGSMSSFLPGVEAVLRRTHVKPQLAGFRVRRGTDTQRGSRRIRSSDSYPMLDPVGRATGGDYRRPKCPG